MLIIPYVCAEFRDKSGNSVFRIRPEHLRSLLEVPDAVKQDILFGMLVNDGSIRTPHSAEERKLLEQEPMLGMTADGKAAENPARAEKPAKESKARTRAEARETGPETKPVEPEQK